MNACINVCLSVGPPFQALNFCIGHLHKLDAVSYCARVLYMSVYGLAWGQLINSAMLSLSIYIYILRPSVPRDGFSKSRHDIRRDMISRAVRANYPSPPAHHDAVIRSDHGLT